MSPDIYLTLAQLARRWNCSTRTVRRQLQRLRLPTCHVTGRPQVRVRDVIRAEMAATQAPRREAP